MSPAGWSPVSRSLVCIAILVYVWVVPVLSGIGRGSEWVRKYIPDSSHEMLLFLCMLPYTASPAVPLIVLFLLPRFLRCTFALVFTATTALLIYCHHDHDPDTDDALAAVGFGMIPMYTAIASAVLAVVAGLIEFCIRARLLSRQPSEFR